jgi:hypothetical protein
LELGTLAVLPPWLELVEPGNDGDDEPVCPELLVLGMDGLLELEELELDELGLGEEREDEELLLGIDGDEDLDEDELLLGIDDELLDELCCSSQAPSNMPSDMASASGRQRREPEVERADMVAVSVFVSDLKISTLWVSYGYV